MINALKTGSRITWRTLNGTRSGTILAYSILRSVYTVRPDGLIPRRLKETATVAHADIIRIY